MKLLLAELRIRTFYKLAYLTFVLSGAGHVQLYRLNGNVIVERSEFKK
jgi:hypothetical protein